MPCDQTFGFTLLVHLRNSPPVQPLEDISLEPSNIFVWWKSGHKVTFSKHLLQLCKILMHLRKHPYLPTCSFMFDGSFYSFSSKAAWVLFFSKRFHFNTVIFCSVPFFSTLCTTIFSEMSCTPMAFLFDAYSASSTAAKHSHSIPYLHCW